MNTNGNGHHEHFHERKAPGAVHDAAFEPLLDSSEAAALLKIHPKTLQKLARNGEIAAIHIGKLWRFRVSALNEWLERIAS
jgi:excisionase family DNA binding protein